MRFYRNSGWARGSGGHEVRFWGIRNEKRRRFRRCSITSHCILLTLARPGRFSGADAYFEIIPIVPSQVSTNWGHPVIGNFVRRSPKACLPSAYKCISTGTSAFFSAM